jgi:hypothetical protein
VRCRHAHTRTSREIPPSRSPHTVLTRNAVLWCGAVMERDSKASALILLGNAIVSYRRREQARMKAAQGRRRRIGGGGGDGVVVGDDSG